MSDEPRPNQPELTPELSAIQRHLQSFAPAPLRTDRDRLMFDAGRAAERARSVEQGAASLGASGSASASMLRANRFWRAAASVMTAASIMLATLLVWQQQSLPGPQLASPPMHSAATPVSEAVVERVEIGPQHFADQLSVPRSMKGYLGVRHVALTRGAGAITSSMQNEEFSAEGDRPATARELLEELLPGATRQRS